MQRARCSRITHKGHPTLTPRLPLSTHELRTDTKITHPNVRITLFASRVRSHLSTGSRDRRSSRGASLLRAPTCRWRHQSAGRLGEQRDHRKHGGGGDRSSFERARGNPEGIHEHLDRGSARREAGDQCERELLAFIDTPNWTFLFFSCAVEILWAHEDFSVMIQFVLFCVFRAPSLPPKGIFHSRAPPSFIGGIAGKHTWRPRGAAKSQHGCLLQEGSVLIPPGGTSGRLQLVPPFPTAVVPPPFFCQCLPCGGCFLSPTPCSALRERSAQHGEGLRRASDGKNEPGISHQGTKAY